MKTIKKYLLVALMFGTLTISANEKENNTVNVKKVKVAFNAVKKGHVISIKSAYGITVYKTEIKENGSFSKVFDLSKLEEGNYTTELEKEFEIIVKSFSVTNGTAVFKNEKTVFKPVIRTENDLVLISKINFNEEPIKIALYYDNEVIYSETTEDAQNVLNRVYKISTEIKGDYKVVIKTNERSFTKEFNI